MGRTSRKRTRRRKEHATFSYDDSHPIHVYGYVQLMKWMVSNGFSGSFLQPAQFQDTGRGLKSTINIQSGDTLMCIPRKLLITTTTVLNSELGLMMKRNACALAPHQMLAVFLLLECSKGPNSFWSPYIALLPKSFDTPAFFTEEELELLPKSVYLSAKAQIEMVVVTFEKLSPFLEVMKKTYPSVSRYLTYEWFRWAWFAVNTRCVYMKQQRQEDNCVMAPFLDLLNHSPTAQTEASFVPSLDCYVVQTATSYKKWQQTFICYGPHGNDKLLLEYGFIVPNNHHSSLQFNIDDILLCMDGNLTSQTNCLRSRKLEILQKCNFQGKLCCGWDGLSWCLVTALKIMCMDSQEIASWKRVYTSSETISTCCDSELVKHLATRLLTRQLLDNQVALQKLRNAVEVQGKMNRHLSIIQGLRQERENLLQISLKQLSCESHCNW